MDTNSITIKCCKQLIRVIIIGKHIASRWANWNSGQSKFNPAYAVRYKIGIMKDLKVRSSKKNAECTDTRDSR